MSDRPPSAGELAAYGGALLHEAARREPGHVTVPYYDPETGARCGLAVATLDPGLAAELFEVVRRYDARADTPEVRPAGRWTVRRDGGVERVDEEGC